MRRRIIGYLVAGFAIASAICAINVKDVLAESISENEECVAGDVELEEEAGNIPVDAAHFPDETFRKYISENFDKDSDSKLSKDEISKVVSIELQSKDIKTIEGIGYFNDLQNIEFLGCNGIREIDLSKNKKITKVVFSAMGVIDPDAFNLEKIDLSGLKDLKSLDLRSKKIEEIDLSDNTELETLRLSTGIESVDISKNTKLVSLNLGESNKIKQIDVSNNTKLSSITLGGTAVPYIDASGLEKKDAVNGFNYSSYPGYNKYWRIENYFPYNPKIQLQGKTLDLSAYESYDPSKIVDKQDYKEALYWSSHSSVPARTEWKEIKTSNIKALGKKIYVTGDKGTYIVDTGSGLMAVDVVAGDEFDKDWQIYQFVSRMYTVALGRDAEDKGLLEWINKLADGSGDGATLAGGFICSEEFKNKKLSDEEYVTTLYKTFFDRDPDEGGKSNWMKALADGTSREEVLAGFVNSKEFANLCDKYGIARGTMGNDGSNVYNKGVRDFVLRIYEKALRREGETEGVEYWSFRINSGELMPIDAALNFFHSEEYLNKNTSDEDYIENLYETFLGRASEKKGKDYWLDQLKEGKTRDDVMAGFAYSQEFKDIMASFGL